MELQQDMLDRIIGCHVKHKLFGGGQITKYEDGKITVDFSGTIKLFQFPTAFQSFLATEEADLQEIVTKAFQDEADAKRRAEEEKRKAAEEAQQRKLEEAQALIEARRKKAQAATQGDQKAVLPIYQRIERLHQSERLSVAFKCNYCDGGRSETRVGFHGMCSDGLIHYNIEQRKYVWCSTGSVCKKYYDGGLTRAELDAYRDPSGKYYACYESSFLSNWETGAGRYQTDEPMHLNRVETGSLAVMTTRMPSDPEENRIIFAVFLVINANTGDDEQEGSVLADPLWRIELTPEEAAKILFWNYYVNARRPDRIVFGSGLHRYLTCIEAAQILRDIANIRDDSFATQFFEYFCTINDIDPNSLEKPSGALIRKKEY